MLYPLDDTIVAIASAPGGAARGILRTTGPAVPGCLLGIFQPEEPVDWPALGAATVVPGSLTLDANQARLPGELYVWPTSRSFTGQPVAEFHTLGSPPLLEAALRAVCSCGARLAEPGEFTLRAFLCGRLDLTQAEAVLGVIDAAGPGEFQAALSQLAGGLAVPLRRLRDLLLDLLAHLEAGFDFADEDLAFIAAGELRGKLLRFRLNLASPSEITLPIEGIVGSEIAVAGPGWDPDKGVLTLGPVSSTAGAERRLTLIVRGPIRDRVAFKPIQVSPSLLRVSLGEKHAINGGIVVTTPLVIEIPPGSPTVDCLGSDLGRLGEIILESTHPQVPKMRFLVRFAVVK